MEFRTPIHLSPSALKINHKSSMLTLGSCFANVMGSKLFTHKFNVLINPFGVIFNPISIFKVIEASLTQKDLLLSSSVENKGIWYNYDLHSDFSSLNKDELNQKISTKLTEIRACIRKTEVLTITLGTAFIYRLIENYQVVANCHKMPSGKFTKELLDIETITNEFSRIYLLFREVNPHARILLTVSPVRHIKDGIEQNSVSKSILRAACYLIQEKYPEVEYFPAYEIMMDDLRDYRFYKEDMIHPTEVAEEYIWEKFLEKYTDQKSKELIREWKSVKQSISHKPFHPQSEAHQKFIKETIGKLEKLSTVLDVKEEIEELKKRII